MNQEQKNRQTDHAAAIKAERHIMRDLGTTREQARTVLNQFREQETAARRQREAAAATTTTPAQPPARIETDLVKFEPRPLTLEIAGTPGLSAGGGGKGGGDEGKPALELLEDAVYLDTDDDTLYYTDIYTTGRKDPV